MPSLHRRRFSQVVCLLVLSIALFTARTAQSDPRPPTGHLPLPVENPTKAYPFSPIPVRECSIGAIPGQFVVDHLGQANYEIPLSVPPGTAGMTPSLSLHYSSQFGDGHFGYGFTLKGLSAISRCRKVLLEESELAGVTHTQADAFCLDGKKLILTSGTYGEDGATYQTNPDSMVKVVSRGILTWLDPFGFTRRSPKYFIVYHKDGTVSEYGGNDSDNTPTNGRILTGLPGESIARAWALSKVYNRSGNFMSFKWSQSADGGEFWVDRIFYSGRCDVQTTGAGLPTSCTNETTPYNSVVFTYSPRVGFLNQYGYQGDLTVEFTRLVSLVSFVTDRGNAQHYRFYYEKGHTSDRSRLYRVEWCAPNNTCLPGTNFSWSDYYPGDAISNGENLWAQGAGGFFNVTGRRKWMSNFGFDLASAARIGFGALTGGPTGALFAVASGLSGVYQNNGAFTHGGIAIQAGITASYGFLQVNGKWLKSLLGDYNGDGKTDLARLSAASGGGTNIRLHHSNGSQFIDAGVDAVTGAADIDMTKTGDFNGDGRSDLLQMTYYSGAPEITTVFLSNGTGGFTGQVWGSQMRDPLNYAVADINGDGMDDLVEFTDATDPPGQAHVFLAFPDNNQFIDAGFWGPQDLGPIGLSNFVDLNGDNRMDIVKFDATTGTISTYINTGSDFVNIFWMCQNENYDQECISLCKFDLRDGDGNCQYPNVASVMMPGDFNGDGFVDVVLFEPHYAGVIPFTYVDVTNATVLLSAGEGRLVYDPRWYIGIDTYAIRDSVFGQEQILGRVADLNGDGFSDIISFRQDPPDNNETAWVMYSRGDGFESRIVWGMGFGEWEEIALGDFDGDGRADIARFPDTTNENVLVSLSNRLPFPDKMVRVIDGQTNYTRVDYGSIANPPSHPNLYAGNTGVQNQELGTRDFQLPLYVVASYEQPTHGEGDGVTWKVDCSYTGSKFNQSRGWLGFEKIDCAYDQNSASPPNVRWSSFYDQRFPKQGLLTRQDVFAQGSSTAFQSDFFNYGVISRFNSSAPRMTSHSEVVRDPVSNGLVRIASQSYDYDLWDNATGVQNNVLLSGARDSVLTNYINDSDRWVFGLPETRNELFLAVSGNPAHNRTTQFTWDVDRVLMLSTRSSWFDGGAARELLSEAEYDAFGNVTQISLSGPDLEERVTQFTYEPKGRFVETITNPLNHVVSTTYDARNGWLTGLVDANKLTTKHYFDSFGRPVGTRLPDGRAQIIDYCAADPGGPPLSYAGYTRFTRYKEDGSRGLVVITDLKNRLLRSVWDSHDLRKGYQDYEYGDNNQLVSKSEPFFQGDQQFFTTYGYDPYHRLISTMLPNGALETRSYAAPSAIAANPVAPTQSYGADVTVTNSIGLATAFSQNDRGDIVQVRKRNVANGNLLSLNSFNFDSEGRLTKIADAAGRITQVAYGAAGAKLSIVDPNTGTTHFVYDSFGQNKTIFDSLGRTTTMFYDKLGRTTRRDEAPASGPTLQTLWVYDQSKRGLPDSVSNSEGYYEEYGYDVLSRKTSEKMVIEGGAYKIAFTFDPYSRVQTIEYPGTTPFKVKYGYSRQGFLDTIANASTGVNYWTLRSLNARGDQARVTMGDGLTTDFGYVPSTGDVNSIVTYRQSNPSQRFQDWSYFYDSERRLTSKSNALTRVGDVYNYDLLNRLTYEAPCLAPPGVCDFTSNTFAYDPDGNITSVNYGVGGPGAEQYTYTYAPNHPNAVSSITWSSGTMNLGYDNFGNLLSDGFRIFAWNVFNKPAGVVKVSGGVTTFKYDPMRSKIFQQSVLPDEQIVYVKDIYEKRSSPVSGTSEWRKIYAPGGLAVQVITDSSGTSTRYVRGDKLGSTDLVTTASGTPLELYRFGGFGDNLPVAGWTPPSQPPLWYTSAGYTGHERVDNVGLIDMGGRFYDKFLRRFVSPDPYVFEPLSTQGLNRYSYVENSPTNFVDPSGFAGWPPFGFNGTTTGGGVKGNYHPGKGKGSGKGLAVWAGVSIFLNSFNASQTPLNKGTPNVQQSTSSYPTELDSEEPWFFEDGGQLFMSFNMTAIASSPVMEVFGEKESEFRKRWREYGFFHALKVAGQDFETKWFGNGYEAPKNLTVPRFILDLFQELIPLLHYAEGWQIWRTGKDAMGKDANIVDWLLQTAQDKAEEKRVDKQNEHLDKDPEIREQDRKMRELIKKFFKKRGVIL